MAVLPELPPWPWSEGDPRSRESGHGRRKQGVVGLEVGWPVRSRLRSGVSLSRVAWVSFRSFCLRGRSCLGIGYLSPKPLTSPRREQSSRQARQVGKGQCQVTEAQCGSTPESQGNLRFWWLLSLLATAPRTTAPHLCII